MWDASLGSERAQPSSCTAEPGGSVDNTKMDMWVNTFAQLMAERKPQDIWVLHPEDSLVAGHLDGGGFQYWLKGLSSLQCSRCLWTWGSAHVYILFHLWWDKDSSQGQVKMRIWSQQCRLCPPGTLGDCQVSPAHVQLFLSKLVFHILQTCYGDSCGPGQCPEICSGDSCEACSLGVCFLQKAPDPTCVSLVSSTDVPEDRHTMPDDNSTVPAQDQQLLTPSSGALAQCARGRSSKPTTIPLLVIDFIEDPLSDSSDFLSEGDPIVIIPFSLVDVTDGHGYVTQGEGSLPEAGGSRPAVIGQGSLCLSGSSEAMPEVKDILVHVRAPIFHCQGLLPSSVQKTFELRGFIFGRQGSPLSPVGVAKGHGPISSSNGPVTSGNGLLPVPYIIGLLPNGEGSIAFPLYLIKFFRAKDALTSVTMDKEREDSGPSPATDGHQPPPEPHTDGLAAKEEGTITFPFIFTNGTKGKKKDGQDSGIASLDISLESSTDNPISVNRGSITVPYSVLSILKRKGPSYLANSHRFVTFRYYKKRRPKSSFGKSGCGSPRREDLRSRRGSRRSRPDPYEDIWICVSLTICFFWLMCMYKLNISSL
ncbi:receptor-transporting protein 5 [Ctenodactylus gundi]